MITKRVFYETPFKNIYIVDWTSETTRGGTPVDCVLQAATEVKILTDKIFITALH